MPFRLAATFFLALTSMLPGAAGAQTLVRFGQPQAGTFQFVPLQVGIETGIFKKHGVDVQVTNFAGGPREQAALTAGSIDMDIGSGPELALEVKGVPEIAVAAVADAPYSIVLAVLKDSPLQKPEDLKGKIVSISSKGSLTDWLARELSRQLGWGTDGFTIAPLGATSAQTAALMTHQIDGMIVEANAGYRLEEEGRGRVLVQFGDRIKTFHIYIIYARSAFAESNPDAVRGFLAGWFETIAYMRAHRDDTIAIVEKSAKVSHALATRDYDELMGMFNLTGAFDPKALAVLARSFVEMGTLPREPDVTELVTDKYLPKAP